MSAYVIDQPDITAIPVRGTDAAFPLRHFLISVQRFVNRCHGKERHSTSYTRNVMEELARLWAVETRRLVGVIA